MRSTTRAEADLVFFDYSLERRERKLARALGRTPEPTCPLIFLCGRGELVLPTYLVTSFHLGWQDRPAI